MKSNREERRKTINDFKDTVQRLSTSQDYLEVVVQGLNLKPPETSTADFPNICELKFSPGTRSDETNRVEMLFGELELQDTTSHYDGTISSDLGNSETTCNMFSTLSISSDDLFGDGPDEKTSPAQSHESTKIRLSHDCESLRCDVKLTYQRSFKLGSSPQTMVPMAEGKCWILASDRKTRNLVDTIGGAINILKTTNAFPLGVASVSSTFVSFFAKKRIKPGALKEEKNQDKHSFTKSKYIRTDPMYPRGFCRTQNGDISHCRTHQQMSTACRTRSYIRYNKKGK